MIPLFRRPAATGRCITAGWTSNPDHGVGVDGVLTGPQGAVPATPSDPETTDHWEVAVELTSVASPSQALIQQPSGQPAEAALATSVAAYETELVVRVLTNSS
jgi:hypothetical protein